MMVLMLSRYEMFVYNDVKSKVVKVHPYQTQHYFKCN